MDLENRVFLGGTCNGSKWRDELIPLLKVDYFNPVVEEWTEECYQKELHEREADRIIVYTITNEMQGVYSIAEVVDDSNKRPERVIFCNLFITPDEKDFTWKSLKKVIELISKNGVTVVDNIVDLAFEINSRMEKETKTAEKTSFFQDDGTVMNKLKEMAEPSEKLEEISETVNVFSNIADKVKTITDIVTKMLAFKAVLDTIITVSTQASTAIDDLSKMADNLKNLTSKSDD